MANKRKSAPQLDPTHGPVEKQWYVLLNNTARWMSKRFPGMGFTILLFPFGDIHPSDPRINYISNAEREDMITAMKEFIARSEGRYHEPKPGKPN